MDNSSVQEVPKIKNISKGIFKLSDNVYAIHTKFLANIMLPRLIYVFLMVRRDPFGLLLFDTGGSGSGPIIYDAIKKLGFSPKDLRGIAISHWHPDHTGGLAELVERLDPDSAPLNVYVSEKDLPLMLDRKPHQLFFHPLLHVPVPVRASRVPPSDRVKFVPLAPDSEENPLAEWGIEFIPTPGHTPGHTAYLHRESSTLFPGCALAILLNKTVGIVPMFWNRKVKMESARKLVGLDFRYLYPNHISLNGDEIPIEKRMAAKGPMNWMYRIAGCYPFFKYP